MCVCVCLCVCVFVSRLGAKVHTEHCMLDLAFLCQLLHPFEPNLMWERPDRQSLLSLFLNYNGPDSTGFFFIYFQSRSHEFELQPRHIAFKEISHAVISTAILSADSRRAVFSYAPVICKPGPHRAGESRDIVALKCHVWTSASSLQCGGTAGL